MKTIHVHEFGDPEVMVLEEAADPAPAAGQILVDVKAAGVNPVDTTFRSGAHPLSKSLALPWTPGIDAAGDVIAVGDGVSAFSPGDRVFGSATSGAYAEKALLNPFRTAKLPDNLSYEEGASLPVVLYTAYYALIYKAGIKAGETVLIHAGAGGVGCLGIQIAKAAGARVITTVSSEDKAAFCRQFDADVVINYREEDFAERCLAETDGRGVDSVVEMVAVENFDGDCRAVKKYGRIVVLGAGTGKNPVGSVNYPPFYSKDIDVRGMSLFNSDPVFPEMVRQLDLMLADGRVRASVGETMPLAEAARSHDVLMTGKVFGKIVLTMGG